MTFKFIKISHNYFLIFILNFCVFQIRPLWAARIPTIKVLILKNKNIRIRADRSIPLTVAGQKFSNKKFKGLTVKLENNRKIMFFDSNKQKIYKLKMQKCICCLSSNTEFLFNTIDLPAGNLNLSSSKKSSLETSLISLNLYKCRNCSHIFNINSKINSKDYDKDVNFTWFESKSWIENSYKLADLVSNKFTSKISYILEIGSGSGNFIRYLSSLTNLILFHVFQ